MSGVDAQLVDQAVKELLEGQLSFPVGEGEMPSPVDLAEVGLATADGSESAEQIMAGGVFIERLGSSAREVQTGWIGATDSMRTLRYHLVGWGIQQDQAVRCSGMAKAVLVDKTAAGYIHDLTVAGHAVMGRAWEADTRAERIGLTWQAGNIVTVMVHATG